MFTYETRCGNVFISYDKNQMCFMLLQLEEFHMCRIVSSQANFCAQRCSWCRYWINRSYQTSDEAESVLIPRYTTSAVERA